MPALNILVIITCILLWFLASIIYRPIGKFICRIFEDAKDEMMKEEQKEANELTESKGE